MAVSYPAYSLVWDQQGLSQEGVSSRSWKGVGFASGSSSSPEIPARPGWALGEPSIVSRVPLQPWPVTWEVLLFGPLGGFPGPLGKEVVPVISGNSSQTPAPLPPQSPQTRALAARDYSGQGNFW